MLWNIWYFLETLFQLEETNQPTDYSCFVVFSIIYVSEQDIKTMVCRHHQYMAYSDQPYLPSCCTVHQLGPLSAQTVMYFCIDARDFNTVMTLSLTC